MSNKRLAPMVWEDELDMHRRSNGELPTYVENMDPAKPLFEVEVENGEIFVKHTSWVPYAREERKEPSGRHQNNVILWTLPGEEFCYEVWKQFKNETSFLNELKGYHTIALLNALNITRINSPEFEFAVGLSQYEPDNFTIHKEAFCGQNLEELIQNSPEKAEYFLQALGSEVRNVHDYFANLKDKKEVDNCIKSKMINYLKGYFERLDIPLVEYIPILEQVSDKLSILPEKISGFIFGDLSLTNVVSWPESFAEFRERRDYAPAISNYKYDPEEIDEDYRNIGEQKNRRHIEPLAEPCILDFDSWKMGDSFADIGILFGYLEQFESTNGVDVTKFKNAFEKGYFKSGQERDASKQIVAIYSAYKHIQNMYHGNNVEFGYQRVLDIFGINLNTESVIQKTEKVMA